MAAAPIAQSVDVIQPLPNLTPEESSELGQWLDRMLAEYLLSGNPLTEDFVRTLRRQFFREVEEEGIHRLGAWDLALLSARLAESRAHNPVGFVNPTGELDTTNKRWLNRQLRTIPWYSAEDKALIQESYTININEGVTDKQLAWDAALQDVARRTPLRPDLVQWIEDRPEFHEYMRNRHWTHAPNEWAGRFFYGFGWSYNETHDIGKAMAVALRHGQKRLADLRRHALFQQQAQEEQETKAEVQQHLADLQQKGGREIFLSARPRAELVELLRIRKASREFLANIYQGRRRRGGRSHRRRRPGQRPGVALAGSLSDIGMELALRLYTRGGDAQLNTYLRNPLAGRARRTKAIKLPRWIYEEPELIQAMRIREGNPNWVPTIDWVVRELRRVMYHAPRTQRNVVLYRGIQSGEGTINNPAAYFTDEGILSATGNVEVAERFTNRQEHCCFLQLFIPAGTPILALEFISEFPNEDEFILAPGRTFVVEQPPLSTANDEVHFGPRQIQLRTGESYGSDPYEGIVYNLNLRPRVLPEEETKEEELPYFETVAYDPTYEPSAMELEEAALEEELAEQELELYNWRQEFKEQTGLRELHTVGVVPKPLYGYAGRHQRTFIWKLNDKNAHKIMLFYL